MLELLKTKGKYCTGCGACYNVCPKDAIRMEPDKDGFLVPVVSEEQCVHCGLCEKTCPVLNPIYKNTQKPDCYAVRAQDEIRQVSSSGGIFTLLAEEILNQEGMVFGAAWQKDWSVHHIAVAKREDLAALRGSKYLQSNTGDTFSQAKKCLQEGRAVLYSGCPCQIAGLYAYLGNKVPQDKLFTIELICHGVPSAKVFQKYLSDDFNVDNIERIDFRDKSVYTWSMNCNIYFKDGTEFHRSAKEDPYLRAFSPCMSMRKSCPHCEFSVLPRQADLTLGDFWGISDFDKTLNDGKGTSVVLVNSARGKWLLQKILPETRSVRVPLKYATRINVTIKRPLREHTSRKHFFSMLDNKPFDELVQDSLHQHYDIGIVGMQYGINYGSVLTYYGLYCMLQDMGYDPVFMPKHNLHWNENFNKPETIAQRFIQARCNVFPPLKTHEQFVEMNDHCTDFIVGSDCIWNYSVCGHDTDMHFFLDWVECGHRKIAYAPSFAGNKMLGPASWVERAKYYIKKFDSISMRESSGVEALQKEYGRPDAVQVLNPVFLCRRGAYDEAADSVSCPEGVFAYVLRPFNTPEQVLKALDMVAEMQNRPVHICGNPVRMNVSKKRFGDRLMPQLSVEEWLSYIKNSSFVIGDSYHAMCFSIIYHKPFVVVYERTVEGSEIARFRSLMEFLGLEDRLLTSWNDLDGIAEIVNRSIDWKEVDRRLEEKRKFSADWLYNALHKDLPEYSAQDYLADHERRLRCQDTLSRLELQKQLKELSRRQADNDALHSIENSRSYRLGRAITWLPRKIRGGYRCVKENGWRYTVHHFGEKVYNFINKKKG